MDLKAAPFKALVREQLAWALHEDVRACARACVRGAARCRSMHVAARRVTGGAPRVRPRQADAGDALSDGDLAELQARAHSDMHSRMRSYAYPNTPRGCRHGCGRAATLRALG